MPIDDFDEPGRWDEYQWERFLQQQDKNTEKYFALLEKYLDHPDRDKLIAGEMGWEFFEDGDERSWDEAADAWCAAEMGNDTSAAEDDGFANSPVYHDTMHLHSWVSDWIDKTPTIEEAEEACHLASQCAICGTKLATALGEHDPNEIGMTIAYLKRALKAANDALTASAKLVASGHMTHSQSTAFQKRLFQVRNHVVDNMSVFRSEWRRRQGENQ